MATDERVSAYDRWKASLPVPCDGNAFICDEPSDHCKAWIIEHVRVWLQGEMTLYSWRTFIEQVCIPGALTSRQFGAVEAWVMGVGGVVFGPPPSIMVCFGEIEPECTDGMLVTSDA